MNAFRIKIVSCSYLSFFLVKYVKSWGFFSALETVLSGGYLCVWLLDARSQLSEGRNWFALMQEDIISFYFGKLIDEGNALNFSALMAVE